MTPAAGTAIPEGTLRQMTVLRPDFNVRGEKTRLRLFLLMSV